MVKVLLFGAGGKMGKAVNSLKDNYAGFDVTFSVDEREGFLPIEDVRPDEVDAVIDISSPEGFRKILGWSVANKKPIVSGTTGLEPDDSDLIEKAADTIPVLHTSNLSRGVNILYDILQRAAKLTFDADIEIIEVHHNKKKDAPSGTALELGRIIENGQLAKNLEPIHGRSGITGERSFKEIGYHSIRCGDVPGEHTVIFAFEGERIELTHRALTRDIFARGAIEAALFISDKLPGKYSMQDLVEGR